MFLFIYSLVVYPRLMEAPYAHSVTGKHAEPQQKLLSVVVEVTHNKRGVRFMYDLIGCLLHFIKQEGKKNLTIKTQDRNVLKSSLNDWYQIISLGSEK